MTVTTRFAPSPTGRLHVGNIRTALHNWLWAEQQGGRMLLRIDDTDVERSEERHVDAIRTDIQWLGLTTAGETRQSARFDLYQRFFERLRDAGRIYPAYESARELDLKRKVAAGRGLAPVYDRAALALNAADRAALEADGVCPHWRFKLDHDAPIEWDDLIRGSQRFDPVMMSDPIIRRADGSWLYMFPSTVDDIDMGVTHVVRGEDHVSNTALQMQIFAALGARPPCFAHEALLVGSEGKLSKRLGSVGVDSFREMGIEPEAVLSLLARIGTSDPVEPFADRRALVGGFDFARFGRAPARFDEAELVALNARIVHQLDHPRVADRLSGGMTAEAWYAVRGNLSTVREAADWWRVVEGPIDPPALSEDDRAYVARAAETVAALAWDGEIWRALTAALKAETGRGGKALFLPLRLAITGRDHGPDMPALLALIGRERVLARLAAV